MKKVSVIVPVYNVEKYLDMCLTSIIMQSIGYQNLEIIVINDGSKDHSEEIIKRYMDKYPDVITYHFQENHGLSATRNYGLEIATGEYVTFLDSDDYLVENALENMYHIAKINDSDLVVGQMLKFNSKKEGIYYSTKYLQKACTFSYLEYPKILKAISACGKLYRRTWVQQYRFIPNVTHEDNYFSVVTYTNAKKISIANEIVYKRRIREGSDLSIMQKLSLHNYHDLLVNFSKTYQDIPTNTIKSVSNFQIRSMTGYLYNYLNKKERIIAFKDTRKFLSSLPMKGITRLLVYWRFLILYGVAKIYKWIRS